MQSGIAAWNLFPPGDLPPLPRDPSCSFERLGLLSNRSTKTVMFLACSMPKASSCRTWLPEISCDSFPRDHIELWKFTQSPGLALGCLSHVPKVRQTSCKLNTASPRSTRSDSSINQAPLCLQFLSRRVRRLYCCIACSFCEDHGCVTDVFPSVLLTCVTESEKSADLPARTPSLRRRTATTWHHCQRKVMTVRNKGSCWKKQAPH